MIVKDKHLTTIWYDNSSDKIKIIGTTADKVEWIKSPDKESDTLVKLKGTDSELFLLQSVSFDTIGSSDFIFA